MGSFKKTTGEVIGKVVKEYAILSESDRSDWVTALCEISWNGKDPNIEIRKYNKTKLKDPDPKVAGRGFGKGVSLTKEELDILTEELVRLGYGNKNEIKAAFKERPKTKKSTDNDEE